MSPRRWHDAVEGLSAAGVGLLRGIIRLYQLLISPLLGQRCRFLPSCSEYASQALQVHGPLRGTALSVRRLCKCHPWHPGGIDEVPPPGGASGASRSESQSQYLSP